MFWARIVAGRMRVLVLLCLLAGAGFSAHAARIVLEQAARTAPATAPTSPSYEGDDHFPGAALLLAADDTAAPAAGVTGTTALPALPPEALTQQALAVTDASIHPARPFDMRLASAEDRARALQCLTTAIYYEAASEPDAGQRAVAQVILNRVRHPAFPATVCGVIYQGSERAGCQFSFACDGSMARIPMRSAWNRALGVASDALAGQVYGPVGLATHYHTYAVTPRWNRSLVMTAALGAHFFHRWQGWWGTPAAFRQGYAGGEPTPAPHPRATPVQPVATVTLAAASPLAAPAAPLPAPTPAAQIQPAHLASGTAQPAYAAAALPESTILDKWKDSGKPLR